MVGLIGDESAQGVDEEARLLLDKREVGGVDLEDERLSTAGRHDGEDAFALAQGLERLALGGMERPLGSENALDDPSFETRGILGRDRLPAGAAFGELG